MVTSSTAAFLVVALSGLAAFSAPTFSISRQIRATFADLRLIGASKAAVGDEVVAFYDEEFCKIDVQRAPASVELR